MTESVGWLVVVMCAACACKGTGTGTHTDAEDPYVYVGSVPEPPYPGAFEYVSFTDPSGMSIDSVCCYKALMPSGGSVEIAWRTADTPSDGIEHVFKVHGVRPGDHFDFVKAPRLPADCASHTAPWSGDVDAVIDVNYRGECNVQVPFGNCEYDTTVDPGTATPAAGDTVISCPHESYDDIRTALVSFAR